MSQFGPKQTIDPSTYYGAGGLVKTWSGRLEIDPKDKLMLDALMDVSEQHRSRRQWWCWALVFVLSCIAWVIAYEEIFTGWLQLSLVIFGAIGFLGFLVFLSAKPFGRNWDSWSSW